MYKAKKAALFFSLSIVLLVIVLVLGLCKLFERHPVSIDPDAVESICLVSNDCGELYADAETQEWVLKLLNDFQYYWIRADILDLDKASSSNWIRVQMKDGSRTTVLFSGSWLGKNGIIYQGVGNHFGPVLDYMDETAYGHMR